MKREEEIKRGAKYNANGTTDDVLAEMYFIRGAEWADEHPKEELWNREKVMLFLIDAFKELPNGHGTFKLKKECSMEQLLEDLSKAMEV